MALESLIAQPFQTIDEVLQGLIGLEQTFRATKDRRGVFVTAYVLITRELRRRIAAHRFEDDAWVARYAVAFANLYRLALLHYEHGELDSVPKSWRASFDTSSQDQGILLQDLILAINAHVNHDLPVALDQVSIDPDRAKRHRDHTAVNDALKQTTLPVTHRIERLYAPTFGAFDLLLGPLEKELTAFSFETAREHAWRDGVALANTKDEHEHSDRRGAIDEQAGVLAQLIQAPKNRLLFDAIRQVESLKPWWTSLDLPGLI